MVDALPAPRAADVLPPLPRGTAAEAPAWPPWAVAFAVPPPPRAVAAAVPPPCDNDVNVVAAAAVQFNLSGVECNGYLFLDVLRGESNKLLLLTLGVSGTKEKSICWASWTSYSWDSLNPASSKPFAWYPGGRQVLEALEWASSSWSLAMIHHHWG